MDEGSTYDKVVRASAKEDSAGFLEWLLPGLWRQYRPLRWLDTRRLPSPGGPDRTSDTIAAWVHRDGAAEPVATIIEFLIRPESRYLLKLGLYCLHLALDERYQEADPVVWYRPQGVLVLLTGEASSVLADDFAGDGSLRWEFRVRCLETEDAVATLDRIEAGEVARCVLPWVTLMTGADDPELAARWRRTADAEASKERRGKYKAWALVLAAAAGRDSMWEVALEGWDVEEPSIVYRWQEQGIAIGEQRERDQAARRMREKLTRLVAKRFGAEAAAEAGRRLEAADADTVSRWFDLAIDADAWPELLASWGG